MGDLITEADLAAIEAGAAALQAEFDADEPIDEKEKTARAAVGAFARVVVALGRDLIARQASGQS